MCTFFYYHRYTGCACIWRAADMPRADRVLLAECPRRQNYRLLDDQQECTNYADGPDDPDVVAAVEGVCPDCREEAARAAAIASLSSPPRVRFRDRMLLRPPSPPPLTGYTLSMITHCPVVYGDRVGMWLGRAGNENESRTEMPPNGYHLQHHSGYKIPSSVSLPGTDDNSTSPPEETPAPPLRPSVDETRQQRQPLRVYGLGWFSRFGR